ncbi:MAG: VTT domain-containing protein [Candidatus Izemoplasma sp.]
MSLTIRFLLLDTSNIFRFLDPIIDFLEGLGHFGLAIYTLIEVLLIIPPIETIYYPLILLDVDHWYLYLLTVTVFNVLASMIGYFVGKKYGYPILRYFSSEEVLEKAKNLFDKYGVLAVALGALTPIPYTIVVFLGGISRMDFKKFVIAGFLGRFPRYLVGGYVVKTVGESDFLNDILMIISIVGMLLFILYYIGQGFYNQYKKRNA